uniref:Uncharacterized protein n=1 Tax=Anguilla anguilla TaxID=7936 RepID=A0A0E9PGY9_ANGAN
MFHGIVEGIVLLRELKRYTESDVDLSFLTSVSRTMAQALW